MENQDSGEVSSRTRRSRGSTSHRAAAFEKLKALKGTKHKYEVTEEAPVYEEVSEKEFSRLVQERQEDDWIVDDNGIGYVEDGREIFDDDVEEDIYTGKKNKLPPKKKFDGPQKRNPSSKCSDIKSMFKALPVKRKNEEVKLDEDEILGSILQEVHSGASQSLLATPKPMTLFRKRSRTGLHHSPVQRFQCNPFTVNRPSSVGDFVSREIQNLKHSVRLLHDQQEERVGNLSPPAEEDGIDNLEQLFDDEAAFAEPTPPPEPLEAIPNPPPPPPPSFAFSPFCGSQEPELESVVVPLEEGQLPLTVTEDGERVLRFFCIDAFEDSYKHPGVVYLFGRVLLEEISVSCCCIVREVPRRMFLLPRETVYDTTANKDRGIPVSLQDVYCELTSILEKMKITEFRTKKSTKNYAFGDSAIPDKCEYLELQYSCRHPPLPSDLSGSTFSHVLGADASSLEILLLEQKLKGPCWVDVHAAQLSSPPVSWCKVEAFVTKIQHIVPMRDAPPPLPLKLVSLHLVTSLNSKNQRNEIAAICCLVHNEFPLDKAAPSPHYKEHFCVLTKPSDCVFPYDFKEAIHTYKKTKIERVDSERALLIYFLAKIHKMDPDIIVGHDVLGFDLDVLLHRMVVHKIPNWSRIGRLRRAGMPRLNNSSQVAERNATCGRLLCDVKISAKELLRCRSYDLEELANHILNQSFSQVAPDGVNARYSSSDQLLQLVDHGMMTSELILRISCELNVLPLALQITNIAGCIMSRTLLGGRSERNEYLLLHAFHEKNFISPPKVQSKKQQMALENDELEVTSKQGRRKPAYEGGLVLEPKKGFYDKYILLMDFNSLYPSIIQEYNICFTTIDRMTDSQLKEKEASIELPDPSLDPGVLPTEIRKLVESRRHVKQMMKGNDVSKERYAQYDIRQRALKLTANSMYGCLGFTHSRFYAKHLAALITRKGREILLKTKDLVEKMGLDVIYGDTDSIMINTNQTQLEEVKQLGNKVKLEINRMYRLLEIDIDGLYKPMLLLKKKKYAALAITALPDGRLRAEQEIKGLDIVRRDWSTLAKEAGEYVIKEILSSKSKDEILDNIQSHLMSLGEAVSQGKRPVTDYIIYKQLTKHPEEYPNAKNLPHVIVACRLNEKSGKKFRMGDTVGYLVCTDGTSLPPTQRAYHPDELKVNGNLKIDATYYLSQQIHPVISRLCAPMEGMDAAMIAKFLGLDTSKYVSLIKVVEQDDDRLFNPSSLLDETDRFNSSNTLGLMCPLCSCEMVIDGALRTEPIISCQLDVCPKCNVALGDHAASLSNQLQGIMRMYIAKYYRRTLVCDDAACSYQTRKMPLVFTSTGPLCPACSKSNLQLEYTEAQLYTQLAYFQHMFDIKKAESALSSNQSGLLQVTDETKQLYETLRAMAGRMLSVSGYGIVNLGHLFQGLFEQNMSG